MNKKWTSTSSTSCKMPSIQEHNENFHICRTHATYSASLSTTQCLSHTHRPSHQSDGMWCHNPNHNCHTNISILQQYQPYLSCNLKKKYIFTKQFSIQIIIWITDPSTVICHCFSGSWNPTLCAAGSSSVIWKGLIITCIHTQHAHTECLTAYYYWVEPHFRNLFKHQRTWVNKQFVSPTKCLQFNPLYQKLNVIHIMFTFFNTCQ